MTHLFNKSAALIRSPFLLFTLVIMSVSYAKGQPTTFFVVPTQPWDDTGLSVTAGETLAITATGEMDYNTNNTCATPTSCTVGPNGSDPGVACTGQPVTAPELPCNSLIGKIGTSGTPFEVGSSFSIASVSAPGELYLGVNDGYFADNTLGWTATIYVSQTPEPSTCLLVAAAGSLLFFFRRSK
jgi:hypothetical protein